MEDIKAQVCEVVYRYAEALDFKKWGLLGEVLGESVEIDYGFFSEDQAGVTFTSAQWVANAERRLARIGGTQHLLSNPRVDVDGHRANCRVYLQAQHVAMIGGVQEWCLLGGEYTFGLTKLSGIWRIISIRLVKLYATGQGEVMKLMHD